MTELPITRRISAACLAPKAWATSTVVAIVRPPATAVSTKITGKVTVTATRASVPSRLPTHSAFTNP